MTKIQRIKEILAGLAMLAASIGMFIDPADAYVVILLILAAGMIIGGIKTLIYYLTMARFAVGGRVSLYQGIIMLDFGIFSASLSNIPKIYVLLYLVGIHAFSGFVEILRANESRLLGAKSWKFKFSHGLVDIIMAVACIVFLKNNNLLSIIYAMGLFYSSVMSIISACRKTAFIYIP